MKTLYLRSKEEEFEAVKDGSQIEITRHVSSKRIKYLCFSHRTGDCKEKQSKCKECFNNSLACGGYMCYPFETAILCNNKTCKVTVKSVSDIYFEERKGDIVFVVRFKEDE